MEYLAIALVMLVASYLITSMMAPGAQEKKPNTLADFDFPQFAEGTPQAVVFGDCWIPDWQVLWYGDLQVSAIEGSGGGKK